MLMFLPSSGHWNKEDFEKVLDLLVCDLGALAKLFQLRTPVAMKHAHPVARCTGSLLEPDKAVLMTPEVTATTSTTALQHYSTVACLGSTSPVFMAPSTSGPTCHATSTSRRK